MNTNNQTVTLEGVNRSRDALAHYSAMLEQAQREAMQDKLLKLFERCDERGKQTILAIAFVQAALVRPPVDGAPAQGGAA